MKKRVLLLILLLGSLLSFLIAADNLYLTKKGQDFFFLTVEGKTIKIQKNSSVFFRTFLPENIDKMTGSKVFRFIDKKLFLFISNGDVFQLKGDHWIKIVKEEREKEFYTGKKNLFDTSTKTEKNIFFKKKGSTITGEREVYILPEDFISFYIEGKDLYLLKRYGEYYIVKYFKVNASNPYPPLNVSQRWEHNYSLYAEEYINEIRWANNSLNSNVQYYNIYRKLKTEPYSALKKIDKVDANVYFYWDRGLNKEEESKYIYGVSVVDITLIESNIATTDGKFIAPTKGPIYQWIFKINN